MEIKEMKLRKEAPVPTVGGLPFGSLPLEIWNGVFEED